MAEVEENNESEAFLCTVGRGLMAFAIAHVKQYCQATNIVEFDGKFVFDAPICLSLLHLPFVERLYAKIGVLSLSQNSEESVASDLLSTQLTSLVHRNIARAFAAWCKLHKDRKRTTTRIAATTTSMTTTLTTTTTTAAVSESFAEVPDETGELQSFSATITSIGTSPTAKTSIATSLTTTSTTTASTNGNKSIGSDSKSGREDVLKEPAKKKVRVEQPFNNHDQHPTSSTFNNTSGVVRYMVMVKSTCQPRHKPNDILSFKRAIDVGIKDSGQTTLVRAKSVDSPSSSSHGCATVTIMCRIDRTHAFVALSLHDTPLSTRSYIRHVGLRPTIIDLMVHLADIRRGAIVFDGTCGKGTILVELLHRHKHIFALGSDVCAASTLITSANCMMLPRRQCALGSTHSVITADLQNCFLRDGCVDAVLSDFPMGRQFNSIDYCNNMYERILTCGGRCIVLTSSLLAAKLSALCATIGFHVSASHAVSLGTTDAVCIVCQKH